MPTQETHASAIAALLTGVIGIVFDVPAPVVFAGFIGTWVGLSVSPQESYLKGGITLLLGTMSSAYLTPYLVHYIGDYSARGASFTLAFVLVAYREKVVKIVGNKLEKI